MENQFPELFPLYGMYDEIRQALHTEIPIFERVSSRKSRCGFCTFLRMCVWDVCGKLYCWYVFQRSHFISRWTFKNLQCLNCPKTRRHETNQKGERRECNRSAYRYSIKWLNFMTFDGWDEHKSVCCVSIMHVHHNCLCIV